MYPSALSLFWEMDMAFYRHSLLSLLYLNLQCFCADIISVLGMTLSDNKDCLNFRLVGSKEDIASWGHEYAR